MVVREERGQWTLNRFWGKVLQAEWDPAANTKSSSETAATYQKVRLMTCPPTYCAMANSLGGGKLGLAAVLRHQED